MHLADYLKIFPPGDNPTLFYTDVGGAYTLPYFIPYFSGIVMAIISFIFALREDFSGTLPRKSKRLPETIPEKKKSWFPDWARWFVVSITPLPFLFFGSMVLGGVISRLGGEGLLASMQIDGGFVFAIPAVFFVSKLFFPKMPPLERMKPVLFAAPFCIIILKISCVMEQVNYGIPVKWGLPVFEFSTPGVKYGADVRVFPYNTFIILFMIGAVVWTLINRKNGKHFQHITPILYGCVFFLDFLLGRDVGLRILGTHAMSWCHLIILAWGIFFLKLEQQSDAALRALQKRGRGTKKKKKKRAR
ncbi:MAG: hypothetical protein LBN05_08220 [Oscillospiraceae bacterium]|jgi:hypothetical protein|nr:hypothetical protein [Oscillospiraceae bacterium]